MSNLRTGGAGLQHCVSGGSVVPVHRDPGDFAHQPVVFQDRPGGIRYRRVVVVLVVVCRHAARAFTGRLAAGGERQRGNDRKQREGLRLHVFLPGKPSRPGSVAGRGTPNRRSVREPPDPGQTERRGGSGTFGVLDQRRDHGVVEGGPQPDDAVVFAVGWTRFVSRTQKSSLSGSTQIEVPVKPVWPNEDPEKWSPARTGRRRRSARGCPSRGRGCCRDESGAAGEAGDGPGAEQALPVHGAAVQQHLQEDAEIPGGGEEPGVGRHFAEHHRVLVVDLAAHHPPAPGVVLGGRDPREQPLRGPVAGVLHPERPGDALLEQDIEGLAADPLQDLAEQQDAVVGIDAVRPGS